MSRDTPSMTRNRIRRSLLAILDPHPSKSQVDALWSYFDHTCAYCGKLIERDSRTGHLDHVIPSIAGGTNDIYNHVLACARCNGDEKRDGDWRSFVLQKSATPEVAQARTKQISEWISKATLRPQSTEVAQHAESIILEALANYEYAVKRLRVLRDDNIRRG